MICISRSKRNKWNLDIMNQYCIDNDIGYKVLDIKYVIKPYQKQLWALVSCNNILHDPYWTCWNNFLNKYRCKMCYYDSTDKTIWDSNLVQSFYLNYGLTILNIKEWKNVDTPIACIDKDKFIYYQSITALKQSGKSSFLFNTSNPYSIDNLRLYCTLYRPEYRLISDVYNGIKDDYIWEYTGEFIPENINKQFILSGDSFINGNCGHPYFSEFKKHGEFIFEQALICNKIMYTKQKKFKDCKDKYVLKFDFYLDEYNEVVEIDGLQHEVPIEYFGGINGFLSQQKRDKIKDDFCNLNNIEMTRISYYPNRINQYKTLIDNKINEILQKQSSLQQSQIQQQQSA